MDDKQRRMHAYRNIDGTLELVLGIALFLIGSILVSSLLPINTETFVSFLPLVIMALFLSVLWFKQRVTYPRTGFVQPRRLSLSTVAVLALSFSTMLFGHLLPDNLQLLNAGYPLFFGALWAVVLLLLGQGLQRFYLYAATALCSGIVALLLNLGPELGTSLIALVTGTVMLVSGGRVLRRYLAEYPAERDV